MDFLGVGNKLRLPENGIPAQPGGQTSACGRPNYSGTGGKRPSGCFPPPDAVIIHPDQTDFQVARCLPKRGV